MKRGDLVRHRRAHGCVIHREGAEHTVWRNLVTRRTDAVPRPNELKDSLARDICRQLGVPDAKRERS